MGNLKGVCRESSLSRDVYFENSYFDMRQLCSLAHQLNEIHKLKPRSILEVGIGNGFVSSFLKRAGYEVYTVDINPDLEPDLVASIREIPNKLVNKKFDLVVCCEVLEHLPFNEFENSLRIFKIYSDNLFMTIPNNRKWFGFSGFLRLPKIEKLIGLGINIGRRGLADDHFHFWEIDSDKFCSRKEVKKIITSMYGKVNGGRFKLNNYHEFFVCTK